MKKITGILSLISCVSAVPVGAQSANELSARWICQADRGYACNAGGCSYIPAQLLKTVNFDAMEVSDLGSSPLRISNLRYTQSSSFSPGATYFTVSYSQIFVILEGRQNDAFNRNAYPFRMTSASASGDQTLYFGVCSPQD